MTNIFTTNQQGLAGAMQSAVGGYAEGSRQVTQAANDIANSSSNGALMSNRQNTSTPHLLNQAGVSLITGELQAQASAKVISTVDGMIGTIIDTYA